MRPFDWITDHFVPALRQVGRLVGVRRATVRNAGRAAAVRRGRRRGTVRGHHRSQRQLPQRNVQRGQRNMQRGIIFFA